MPIAAIALPTTAERALAIGLRGRRWRCRRSHTAVRHTVIVSAVASLSLSQRDRYMRGGSAASRLAARVLEHCLGAVGQAAPERDPFPHVLIDGFFPRDVYEELLANFPAAALYEPMDYGRASAADEQ